MVVNKFECFGIGDCLFILSMLQNSLIARSLLFGIAKGTFYQLRFCSNALYIQGQIQRKNLREYFYYIDHQGMLFLDDARLKNFTSCFKDKQFLVFFFNRIQRNTTSRYEATFPFVSLCGRERNYIRCEDVPIVYSHVIKIGDKYMCCYGNAGDLLYNEFCPDKVFMEPNTGRVYHPCHEAAGCIGLVASKLAIEFSKNFLFDNGETQPPSYFTWDGQLIKLDSEWYFNENKSRKKIL